MTRRITLPRAFTGGMVTDFSASDIGPSNSTFAQDGYSPQGTFKQRGGWAYDGSVADVSDDLEGVYRAQFALAGATRTVTVDDDGDFFVHNSGGAGTALFSGVVRYLPRAVYRDEILFCAVDGITPMRRYGGALTTGTASDLVGTTTANRATISALSFSAQPDPGSYLISASAAPGPLSYKILNTTSTAVTLEDVTASATASTGTVAIALTGFAFPAVGYYNAGTMSGAAGTATGVGTLWIDDAGVVALEDALLQQDTSTGMYHLRSVTNISSNTSLTAGGPASTDITYQLTRACPFKDVAAHRESLWGTGVAQYPNRVYVSPPGWNPALPPGFTLPYDMIPGGTTAASLNANDFLLDFIDVPSPYDGDHNVALLSSPNHLWVLKREKAYGIHGSFGGLDVSRDPIGPGCIDIRSAITVAEGNFWASEDDVFWAPGDVAQPLMVGKIQREWRALTRDFDYGVLDYCSMGVASGHLIVHITTGAGTTQRTYLCDLRDQTWQSRISNVTPRHMFSSRINGEKEKLFAVSDARQGRVLDLAPMLDGSGTADDDAGSAPRLQAYTPEIGADGVEGVTRLVDVAVHANVVDAGAAGTTSLEVSTVSQGGIGNPAAATKTLTAIESDTTDNLNRHHRRIARDGRLHQVRFAVDATGTDTTATKVEIDQVDLFLRDGRRRSR